VRLCHWQRSRDALSCLSKACAQSVSLCSAGDSLRAGRVLFSWVHVADVPFMMSIPWCECDADLLPVLLAIQILLSAGTAPDGDRGKAAIFAAIVYGPILFVTVLIQQLGHGLAARSVGGEATTIVLWPLGGMTYCGHDRGMASCQHLGWHMCQMCRKCMYLLSHASTRLGPKPAGASNANKASGGSCRA
jgi:hypothetical protein